MSGGVYHTINQGVSTSVASVKRRLDIAKTNKSLVNLRSLLRFLVERAGVASIEVDILSLDKRDEDIVVLKDCFPGGNWANGFLRALMLDITAQNNYEEDRRRLNELVRRLKEYESGVVAAIARVSEYNDYLKPPEEVKVGYVQINDQTLIAYRNNVMGVREAVQELIDDMELNPDKRVLGQVFYVIVSLYVDLLDTLDDMESKIDAFRDLSLHAEVKVAFTRSIEEIMALPADIWELSPTSREAFLSSVQSLIKELFDARGLIGGSVIAIQTGKENSQKLVGSARATQSKLETLRKQIAEVQIDFKDLVSAVKSATDSTGELINSILEGGE